MYYKGYEIDKAYRVIGVCNMVLARCDSVQDAKETINEFIEAEIDIRETEESLLYDYYRGI